MTKLEAALAGLSPEQRELLLLRLKARERRPAAVARPPAIPRYRGPEPPPLSFAQQRLWFIHQLEPDSAAYNMVAAYRASGRLDRAAVLASLSEIVRRHATLRTTFVATAGRPVVAVAPPAVVDLPTVDLTALPAASRAAEELRLAHAESRRPFDLARGPILRATLVRQAADLHTLLLNLHHIVSDAWSMGVMVQEIGVLYAAFSAGQPSPLPELPVQYADFALWQRERLSGELLASELAYWREALAGLEPLDLPTDRPRAPVMSGRGGQVRFTFVPEVADRLASSAAATGATLFMTLLAAFAAVLTRYTGQADLAAGSPIASRTRRELEGLIGLFVNTLVLRIDGTRCRTFGDLLAQVRAVTLAAYDHQELPLERIVEELKPERDPSRNPLFDVMFALQNAPMGALELPGLTLVPILDEEPGEAMFDLTLQLAQRGGVDLAGNWDYNSDLFDEATIARLSGHYEILLAAALIDPATPLLDLPLLTPAERAQLAEWSGGATAYPREETVHGLFLAQTAKAPDAVALVGEGGGTLTCGELARRAERLARRLRRLGVGPEVRVGLFLDRSPERILATLGVLLAGGAYVPLDPSHPAERLAFVLADSGASVLLTEPGLRASLPETTAAVLTLDDLQAAPLPGHGDRGTSPPATGLAYVIYTSGSTGTPKGVAVPHRGIVRLVRETAFARFDAGEVYLQLAAYAFDAATLEVWAPLLHGGRLVVPPAGPLSLAELGDLFHRHGVTTLFLTAALLHQLVDENLPALSGVRQLFGGGDVMSPPHAERALRELPGVRLVNGYGPTENTSLTATFTVPPERSLGGSVPLGRPIANTWAFVLDRQLAPVPAGVPGELCAAGDGLARGYLGRPDLTAERFVPNPFPALGPGERLYRTGDLARFLPAGDLEFLGRRDSQVKIRGFRVEPGEIEAVLAGAPGVRAAVVVPRPERGGGRRLVAYLVGEEGEDGEKGISPDLAAVREHLRARLPEPMLPTAFVILPALPVTPLGKVDRKALPEPAAESAHRAEEAAERPRNPIEETLAGIWAEVLGVDAAAVGIHDSFFALGGHSLLATQVVSRIRQAFGVEVPLRRLFEEPTVAGLAAVITGMLSNRASGAPPLRPRQKGISPPLSFAQQRLWFIDQLEPGTPAYNIAAALAVRGPLAPATLAAALTEVVRRHEALRTVFPASAGKPVQQIGRPQPLALPRIDLSALPEPGRGAEAGRLTAEEALCSFGLARGPLLRATLLALGRAEHVLLFTLHHIVGDGWSMGVLVGEVSALYAAFRAGRPSPLPELPLQYADFALWQRSWLAGEVLEGEIAWWRERLAGMPEKLELPTDHPRPAVASQRGASVLVALPEGVVPALQERVGSAGATPFMVLLSGLAALLARLSGQEKVVVGTPVANRTHREIEPLIGFFVNTLPLPVDLAAEPDALALLSQVRETALAAYAHQDLPFEKLVEELSPERSLAYGPLFQVMLALQNAPLPRLALADVELAPIAAESGTESFDLTWSLDAREDQEGIAGLLSYRTDLFERATAERFAAWLGALLQSMLDQPERRISELPLLSAAERRQILAWSSRSDGGALPQPAPTEADAGLFDLFAAQAARTPESEALVVGTERWSYADLAARAALLAEVLRGLGVKPESRVAVCLERGPALVPALLAVLQAGGAYVPLDPSYPAERLAFLLADSEAEGLVTQAELRDRLPALAGWTLVLDAHGRIAEGGPKPARPLAAPARPGRPTRPIPGNLAYLIYTSGSTGRPKAVAVEHRSAVALVRWALGVWSREELSGVLFATSVNFDLSVFELFVPLASGGRVILAENALALPDLPAAGEVTLVNTVPSAMAELVRQGRVPAAVRTVNLAGEALPRPLAEALYRLPRIERVWNLYGPSEDTTYSTSALQPRVLEEEPRIGRPLPGTHAHVLDRHGDLSPTGMPGELCLGGAGLARGYLGRPDLTAERFVPDPFSQRGERLYRTGDRVRHRPGGDLEFLGREDHRVKVRGFRIELGEVEAALAACPGVEAAAVLPREGGLAAYVAAGPGSPPALPEALRAALSQRLPDYMVPGEIAVLERLPLSPNGKIDRKALGQLRAETAAGSAQALPQTATEAGVAKIWGQVLGRESVGALDNFFQLGGHSLLATQVVSRLREVFGVEMPVKALFERPTVRALAAAIDGGAGEAAGREPGPPIRPHGAAPRMGPLPLSFAQERLWFLDQLAPGSAAYNLPLAVRLRGHLSRAALALSLAEIVRRHETLRTTFAAVAGRPRQTVAPPAAFTPPLVDLGRLPESVRAAESGRLARGEALRPFDLARGPLLRAALLRLAPTEHVALLTMHHIVSDGWSMGVLVRELGTLYPAFLAGRPSPLPDLAVQYSDYAAWQRERLSGEILENQLAYWRGRLSGAPALLELPVDRPRPPVRSGRGAEIAATLTAESLDGLARRRGATLFMATLAALAALLSRLTGRFDLTVGAPIAGRTRREIEGLIGFFVNTLVFRVDLSRDPTFGELLDRVRERTLEAYAHQDLPFERLVEELAPERSLAHSPLFQMMFTLQNAPFQKLALPGLDLEPVPLGGEQAKFDLSLTLEPTAGSLRGVVGWSRDLFDRTTVERMLGQLRRLIAEAEAGCPLSALPLLGAAERHQVLVEWSDTDFRMPEAEARLDRLFVRAARRSPDAVALVAEEERLTFGELDRRSGRLARRLRSLGVGPESRVGLCAERSLAMVVGLLGVLRAGGAYVPLDPAHPKERLALLLEDVQAGESAPVLLAQKHLADRLPERPGHRLFLDAGAFGSEDLDLGPADDPGNAAYIIFTSGSTGLPKGVVVEHRQVVNYVRGIHERTGLAPDASFALVQPLTVDSSKTAIFPPLLGGGTLHLISQERALAPGALAAYLRRHEVEGLKIAPSHLSALQASSPTADLLPRGWLIFGGEASRRDWALGLARASATCRVFNHYGPTEATVGMLVCPIEEGLPTGPSLTTPLGRPLANSRVYALDRSGNPVPPGVAGELYIGGSWGGSSVARGYFGRPELTAERFLPDPFTGSPAARLYRTGDLVRHLADGRIEFLGRLDDQVKIRGFRIEPGEIEAALCRHPRVREAVVAAPESSGGARRLVGYVVPRETPAPAAADLRLFLAERLPEYMVPSAFAFLDALPRTAHGKVDRRALAEVRPAAEPATGGGFLAPMAPLSPRTPTEELLSGIWAEVLGLDRVGVLESFFELGGHSLLAVQVVSRVREALGVELPLRRLFETPTVAALASAIAEGLGTGAPPIRAAPRTGPLPLSFAQERLWFFDQLAPGSTAYNVPVAFRLAGRLDVLALLASLAEVVRRHEVLRTTFAAIDGWPVQVIAPAGAIAVPCLDLSRLSAGEREAELLRLARAEARRPFDLRHGPLLRATLVRLAGEDHAAFLSLHHIVSDGWSTGVLVREIGSLYAAFVEGRSSPLAPLPIQYADFAAWQREHLDEEALSGQLAAWTERLAGAPLVLDLPADRPRPPVQSWRGGTLTFSLPDEVDRALPGFARDACGGGATPFMVLLAGFFALLHRTTGRNTLLVGSTDANRHRRELEELIGFFVNSLVFRSDLPGSLTFRALVAQARETALFAYAHADLPFEKLVEALRPERDLSRSPVVQVVFQLLNAPAPDLALPGLTLSPVGATGDSAKFDLVANAAAGERGWRGTWHYNSDLFNRSTVLRLAEHFQTFLAAALMEPDRQVADLPLLSPGERHQLLTEWNEGLPADQPVACLHEIFARTALARPEATAVTYEGASLRYGELLAAARRLGRFLARQGVLPGDLVGLCLDRSLDLVVAILGVLEAGAAYVPLDPGYPQERLAYVLADSGMSVLLTASPAAESLPEAPPGLAVIDLEAERERIAEESAEAVEARATPDGLAYVIYTSGSTGRPKGVGVRHGEVARLFAATDPWFDFTKGADVWTLFHSYAFDFSVWEIWGALLHDGRLVVVPYWTSRSPEAFRELLRREKVTILNQTPSAFRQLIWAESAALDQGKGELALRCVIFGGEALEIQSLAPWWERHEEDRPRLVNMYGITETTVHVTYRPLGKRDLALPGSSLGAIGRPIPDLSVHLLDAAGEPAPMGVPGELHVGGAGLALGYLGRPDLTAQRFIPNPWSRKPGTRLYRSGDLARYRADGDLDYLGRIDEQVKIRGFRIELGEIASVLVRHPELREAVVLALSGTDQERRLAAYVVAEGEPPTLAELRRFAAEWLPDYMLPAGLAVLPKLPVNSSGKVDRRALAALPVGSEGEAAGETRAARTPLERYLADLWAEVLGLAHPERLGVDDDFFALGGNSISGAVLINRLQQEIGEIVQVVVIFDAPTIALLARYLASQHKAAVVRIWGRESLGEAAESEDAADIRITEEQIAELQRWVRPLGPAPQEQGKNPRAIFVLSPPRSGSTLLRVMLGGHPRLFAPPELELLSYQTLAERRAAFSGRDSFWLEGAIRAVMEARGESAEEAAERIAALEREGASTRRFYGLLQSWLGDRLLVDKTPSYALDPAILERAEEEFEEPFYIHLTRHPHGMIRSFEEAKLDQIFFRGGPGGHPFTRRELAELIWLVSHRNIGDFLAKVPASRQHTVRFEDLTSDPEAALTALCVALGLDYEPAMASPYEDRRSRMTDGLHAESRMLGDVKFHTHRGVESAVAERWKEGLEADFLGDPTWEMAAALDYPRLAAAPAIPPRPRDGGAPPLSFAQERLWFLDQLEPGRATYNIAAALRLSGNLDAALLAASLQEVVRRHESLRTTFAVAPGGEGTPSQVIAPSLDLRVPRIDLSHLGEVIRIRELRRLATAEAARPFDLSRGPLLRANLVRLSAEEHAALFTLHHIVSDGWSMGVLIREVCALYGSWIAGRPSPLPELPIQYPDFAAWQRRHLTGEVLADELAHWRQALAGVPVLDLPADRPRPLVRDTRGGTHRFRIGQEGVAALELRSREASGTLFMTLLAGLAVLLSRYSGQSDLAVGIPIANRTHREIEPLIGFFVNTLVLRTPCPPGASFRDLLTSVRQTALAAYQHQDVPFERVVEELAPQRDPSRTPLFQVMFALQNAAAGAMSAVDVGDASETVELPGLTVAPLPGEGEIAKFDLTVGFTETGDGLAGTVRYSRSLFDAPTAARMAAHLANLLEAAASQPELSVAALPLLSAAEAQQALREWNDDLADYPREGLIPERLAAREQRHPDAVALALGEEQLSYGELRARSERLAGHLRAAGVGPETRVGVALDRSLPLVAALLAVWRSGGAYVPLDPTLPPERLAFLLADSRVPVLLTRRALAPALPSVGQRTLLVEDLLTTPPAALLPLQPLQPENPAYVLYTSGSTGRPKGVVISHAALANRLRFAATIDLTEGERYIHKTTASFDPSIVEIFGPLLVGGTTILARPGGERDPAYLLDLLRDRQITQTSFTQSMLATLLEQRALAGCPSLCTVLSGGEAMPPDLPERFYAQSSARLQNRYGPTETTISSTAWLCRPGEPGRGVPIGRPIARNTVFLVDRELKPVPIGVPGEITVGGMGLARGYLDRPALSAEKFVPNPFGEPGSRLYRTGDLSRFRTDGAIEFMGRSDGQVKIRGFRVELGEIEAALLAHPDVEAAAVVDREEPGTGSRRLVAYYVPREGTAPAEADLAALLATKMPAYMVPGAFVALPALPLSPTGKLDRAALPEPAARGAHEKAEEAPRGPVEELVASVWSDLLRLPEVGREANFFELGGHSLLATRVMARVRRDLGVEVPLRRLFDAPVLADFAAEVESALGGGAPSAPPLVPRERGAEVPLSFAQERLWFLDQLEPGSTAYLMPGAVRFSGPLDPQALATSLDALVSRHEVLRTRFAATSEGRPVQVVAPDLPLPRATVDLSALPESAREAEARRLAREEAARPFDLAAGPLLRVALVRIGAADHAVLFTMHHIVSDGWSMGIFVRELAAFYQARLAGRPAALPPLPIQYADFAIWQREWLSGPVLDAEIAWWKERLAGAPAVTELPADRPRPLRRSGPVQGGHQPFRLDAGSAAGLDRLAKRLGATPFMLLLSGLAALLERHGAQADLVIGSALANRSHREIEGLIGFFVNTLPLRIDLAGDPRLRDLALRVREEALAAFGHQDLPFEKLVQEIQPERSLARTPLFQVLFVLQNTPFEPLDLPGLRLTPMGAGLEDAKFDLTLSLSRSPMGISGGWSYDRDLFDRTTMARLAGHFERLLEALATQDDLRLSDLPLLSAAERQQLAVEWSDTRAAYPRESPLHELFAEQAATTPDAISLVSGSTAITYAELDRRANGLARRLQGLGVGPDLLVGICLERSLDGLVAMLAVLKAGGAYVPLDPSYPKERLALLAKGIALVITAERWLANLPPSAPTLCLDREPTPGEPVPLPSGAGAENLAYILYTSGSTGTPKGVAVPHRAVVRLLRGAGYARFGPDEVFLQLAPLSFDASTFEIWAPLLHGGRLVVPPPGAVSLAELGDLLARHGVTTLWLTAGLFHQAVEEDLALFGPLRQLLAGGDVLAVPPARRVLQELPGTRLINGYGPTESTTFACCFPVRDERSLERSVPLGLPIANTTVHLVDSTLHPVPLGAPGEIAIGGDGLARGYLGRPDSTAAQFVPNPWGEPGSRLYRTGDLARWASGLLEFLGRIDGQVKIRGFRIETGEIEATLAAHPAVEQCAVVVREDRPGDRRLVAYLAATPAKDTPESLPAALLAHAAERLPAHLVPAAFVVLPALPLNANGKVDRAALPAPEWQGRGEHKPPRTAVEEVLAGLWEEVLGVERVGIDDNFFHLGGHSLLATRLVSRIRSAFQVELPLRHLFETPTVAAVAAAILAGEPQEGRSEKIARVLLRLRNQPRGDRAAGG